MSELAMTELVTRLSRPPPPAAAISPGPPRWVIVSVPPALTDPENVEELAEVEVIVTTADVDEAVIPAAWKSVSALIAFFRAVGRKGKVSIR